jgi:hypothetical protein
MANIPDMSKLKGKFDLQGIMKNVKSIINPNSIIPESAQGNPVAFKLAEVIEAVKVLADAYGKQADIIARLNTLVGELSHEISLLQTPAAPPTTAVNEQEKKSE